MCVPTRRDGPRRSIPTATTLVVGEVEETAGVLDVLAGDRNAPFPGRKLPRVELELGGVAGVQMLLRRSRCGITVPSFVE